MGALVCGHTPRKAPHETFVIVENPCAMLNHTVRAMSQKTRTSLHTAHRDRHSLSNRAGLVAVYMTVC